MPGGHNTGRTGQPFCRKPNHGDQNSADILIFSDMKGSVNLVNHFTTILNHLRFHLQMIKGSRAGDQRTRELRLWMTDGDEQYQTWDSNPRFQRTITAHYRAVPTFIQNIHASVQNNEPVFSYFYDFRANRKGREILRSRTVPSLTIN